MFLDHYMHESSGFHGQLSQFVFHDAMIGPELVYDPGECYYNQMCDEY